VLFADYTPGSLLLFAPVARIFGCTPYTDTYFDLALLVLMTMLVLAYLPDDDHSHRKRVLAAVVLGVMLPVGVFQMLTDRPENLALSLFFVLLLLWKKTQRIWSRSLIAGLSACLFVIHPYVGITSYMLFVLLLVIDRNVRRRLLILAGSGTVAAVGILAWISALHFADPTAIHRFMEHAFGVHSGAGRVLKHGQMTGAHLGFIQGHLQILAMYLDKSNRLRVMSPAALVCYFLILGAATIRLNPAQRKPALLVFLALICILLLFPLAIFPGQGSYFSASGAMVFAMAALGGNMFLDEMRKTRVLVLILITGAIFSLPGLAIDVLRAAESRISYERAQAQVLRVKQMFTARGLEQPHLLIDSSHYFVYKPYFHYLYNAAYFQPDDSLTAFDGLVRCYTATPAFTRADLTWEKPFRAQDWELIDGDLYAVPISFLGHRLLRRDWSWSCDVYVPRRLQH
jgi:hypothetical protein